MEAGSAQHPLGRHGRNPGQGRLGQRVAEHAPCSSTPAAQQATGAATATEELTQHARLLLVQARQQLGQHARILQLLPPGLSQSGQVDPLLLGSLLQKLAELGPLLRGHAAERVLGRLLVGIRRELGRDLLVAPDRLVVGDARIGWTLVVAVEEVLVVVAVRPALQEAVKQPHHNPLPCEVPYKRPTAVTFTVGDATSLLR